MQKLYTALKVLLNLDTVFFCSGTFYSCWRHFTGRDAHILTAVPWYLGIHIRAALCLGAAAILLLAMHFVKRNCQ